MSQQFFFGITSFIKRKNNIFESYLFLVVDARFSRNSLANPASCTQLALLFLKLVPASKIMEMFLLSAAPPSLSWRRDRFPSKPLKLPLFLFFCQQWTVDPLPLDIHRLTTKDAQIFRDLPELEALPSTTRHTWRIHLCHHDIFAITTSLPSWYPCHHYIFANMISLLLLQLCHHYIFAIIISLPSLHLCHHDIFAIMISLPSWHLCH